MKITDTTAFFTEEEHSRIVDHMNEDHADAVLNYVAFFSNKLDVHSALLIDIDQNGMDIEAEINFEKSLVRIDFQEPLKKPDDAHLTLVAMAREARKSIPLKRAQLTINSFRKNFQTVILGTAAYDNVPDASVAPAVLGPDKAFYAMVSDLSVHTKNMSVGGNASVLIIEDENKSEQILARRRLTFDCKAREVLEAEACYADRMKELKEKFGPLMDQISNMADFHMYRLHPTNGRLINGFGQAFHVNPKNWNEIKQIGGKGQGHKKKEES